MTRTYEYRPIVSVRGDISMGRAPRVPTRAERWALLLSWCLAGIAVLAFAYAALLVLSW
jgi:hypothetical protein